MYKLDDGVLKLVERVDKLGDESSAGASDTPQTDSFCQFVVNNGPLLVINPKNDPRMSGSSYQGSVVGYV